jgi:TM2 domain
MVLAVFTGFFGGHRFYAGKIGSGIGMIFTLGGFGLWWIYDCILVAAGEFRDIDDRRIVNWERGDASHRRLGSEDERHRLLDSMEDMRSEMFELQERVDFMERMLADVRRHAVPPPPV